MEFDWKRLQIYKQAGFKVTFTSDPNLQAMLCK